MGFGVNNIATADTYPGDNAQRAPIVVVGIQCVRVTIIVKTNDVYFALQGPTAGLTGGTWSQDHYIPVLSGGITFVSLDRYCSGVRVKSAVAGAPAMITAELIPASEIPGALG